MTIDTKTVLVYLGNIDDRYPRAEQLANCKKAVKDLGLPSIGRGYYEHNELDELIRHCRGNELVMLPRLGMLAQNRKRGIGNRFLMNLLKVTNEAMVIMDIHAELTSYDGDKWYTHIERTRNALANGRPMSSKSAKMLRKLRNPIGLENHWNDHVKKNDPERFNRLAQHWRDPRLTAKEAIEQSPDEELGRASRSMWERIFGNRT